MVVGKLLILLSSIPASAEVNNPRFFEYRGGPPLGEFINFSFGWFKTLDDDEKSAYYQSINHAVMYAENGQSVEWFKPKASGWAKPVMTWPTGSGYCRRIYIQAIAYNTEKLMMQTACFDNASGKWQWIRE
jgi:surface antigen